MSNRIKILSSIEEVPREDWNNLGLQSAPILDWEYLYALEKSGTVSRERGYHASHIALYEGERPLSIAPFFQRDRAWVEFGDGGLLEFLTELTGLPFNKGLVGAIPYTPIPGYDFLHAPGADSASASQYLLAQVDRLIRERGLSTSRIYFVAPESRLNSILTENGYITLSTPYLVWYNHDYASFNDYLASFKSTRRTKIKREWRSVRDRGVRLEMVEGSDAPDEFFDEIYLLYRRTWVKHMGLGVRPFLNESFFKLLAREFRRRTAFATASLNGKRIGMALFFRKNQSMYGRYWGCFREVPFLHFATCYYFPIAYGIESGILKMDPGFGGEHKYIRGFEPAPVSHYIKFYDEKQRRIALAVIEQMKEQLILK